MNPRQLLEPPGDPDVLTRRTRRQSALPGDPLRARAAAPAAPRLAAIELRDQLQPAAAARVDVRGEFGDLVLEALGRQVLDARPLLQRPLILGRCYEHTFDDRNTLGRNRSASLPPPRSDRDRHPHQGAEPFLVVAQLHVPDPGGATALPQPSERVE